MMRSWDAIPGMRFATRPDVALVAAVAAMLAVLLAPLPGPVLDGAIATQMGLGGLLLVTALRAPTPLSLSSFPALLLGTTLLRLCLNVATTRRILGQGDGGAVVEAIGRQLAAGDVVLGLVILGILILVQLLVVGKGAERVAEVGARFALDALPGQQMSIDAELRAGTASPDEAASRRQALQRESQFRGAMDGAMKFVKGDAICGLVLTALNLVAGATLGVLRDGLPLADAVDRYAILTVGDGLTSQIPALTVALTAGVLATRGAPDPDGAGLGPSLGRELFGSPVAPALTGGLLAGAALIPSMPPLPFLGVAAGFGLVAWLKRPRDGHVSEGSPDYAASSLHAALPPANAESPQAAMVGPVPALGIDLDPELSERLGLGRGADDRTSLLAEDLPAAREHVYEELGIRIPGVQVRSHALHLEPGQAELRLRGIPMERIRVPEDRILAIELPDRLRRLGIDVVDTNHPLTGAPAAWVPEAIGRELEETGVPVWGASGVLALHLVRLTTKMAVHLVGLQEVSDLVKRLETTAPDLVRETVPKVVGLSLLTDVVRRLIDERISVRDFETVLGALAEHGAHQADPVLLTEQVRCALSLQIAHDHAGPSGRLGVVLVEPEIEQTLREAIVRGADGSHLALEPELRQALVARIEAAVGPLQTAGAPPVLLTEVDVRRYLHKLLEGSVPGVVVLSLQELPGHLTVQPLGQVTLEEPEELQRRVA